MAIFDEISTGGSSLSGVASFTSIYNGNHENIVCLADNFRGSVIEVDVENRNGELVYVFGKERGSFYGVVAGTYRFNVPQAYPIAFHTSGKTNVSYTGQFSQGSKVGLDGFTYQFFYGIVTLTVLNDFGRLSYQSFNNGYLGGFRHIDYTLTCYNSVLNRAKGADVSLGETSVGVPQAIRARYNVEILGLDVFRTGGQARVSVLRSFNGTGGAITGGIAQGIKNPIISTIPLRVGGGATIDGGKLSNPIIKGGGTSGLLPSPGGGVVWQNTNGALRENDLQSCSIIFDSLSGSSNYLYISNFNVDLPEFATPRFFKVRIKKSSSVGEILDEVVALTYGSSSIQTTDSKALSGFWPLTPTSFNYGDETDNWGRSWTREEVVHPNFGVIISVLGDPSLLSRGSIDYVELSVYYYQLIEEQITGTGFLGGEAECGVVSNKDATGGARASGVSLVVYENIDTQGGILINGEAAYNQFITSQAGLGFLGGSATSQIIVNGNSQSVILLRLNNPSETNENVINTVTIRPVGPSWRGDWLDQSYNKDDIVKENSTFYVCLQYWDGSETRTPTEDIASYGGVYWAAYTGPVFYVFGEEFGRYGLVAGVYKFNVPASHPIAFLVSGRPSLSFTGEQPRGTKVGLDGNTYTFYYGIVTLTISAALWNRIGFSYQSWENGYLGGLNNIVYSASGIGQNADINIGGTSTVNVYSEKTTSSGAACSGIAINSHRMIELLESYGATLSGEADRALALAVNGGAQLGGESSVNQVFNIVDFSQGAKTSGTTDSTATYTPFVGTSSVVINGSSIIGIQPKTGDGAIIASGSTSNVILFIPIITGHAKVNGSHILQQTYNSIFVLGYARISGKARQERIRLLIKTQLNRALSMASPNILNTPPEDPNKLIRSIESEQPVEIESTSYRLQHEPGWCDIGESCKSPYLPEIVKKRQGKYIPNKKGRYVASRQIATMTQE